MRGSDKLLAGHRVMSDSTVHYILVQAASFAWGHAWPAGGGGGLAGSLLQAEPSGGHGGGGPDLPAQAQVSATSKRPTI